MEPRLLRKPHNGICALFALTLLASPAFAAPRTPSVKTPVVRKPVITMKPGRAATVGFQVSTPSWSRDGKMIALIETKNGPRCGNVWLYRVGSGMKKLTSTGLDGSPSWTADGRLVVARVNGSKWSFVVLNTTNGSARPLVSGRTFPLVGRDKVPSAVSFSPDGTKVTFDVCKAGETVDDSGRIQIMDLKTQKVTDLKTPEKSVTSFPTWSPCGRYIAYKRLPKGWYYNKTGDESYSHVWLTDLRTNEVRQVTTNEKEMNFVSPQWSPDGAFLSVEKWLVSMKRESRRESWIVDVKSAGAGAFLLDQGRNSGGVRWAPDGKHYAFLRAMAINGKFSNELWVGVVSPTQRAAALKPPAVTVTSSNPSSNS